jgi:hypothetical protein
MSGKTGKDKTINILFIPGGAMFGIIPAVVLARLEELTETPTTDLFQVMDGVSTGSILVGGLNVRDDKDPNKPKMSASESVSLFCEHGPHYFPDIPNRYYKMMTANIVNIAQDSLDPDKADGLKINEIKKLIYQAKKHANAEQQIVLDTLEKDSTTTWLSKGRKNKILKLCEQLGKDIPQIKSHTNKISELVFARTSTGSLGRIFKKAAIGSLGLVKKAWAKEYLFDPDIPKNNYRRIFGDARMQDSLKSTYISTYDMKTNKVKTFFNRKADFFSSDQKTSSVSSKENAQIWDAVMASTANPFAFPPHITEDHTLCTDRAPVHSPLPCVLDVIKNKPKDAKVRLIILGTGKYLKTDFDKESLNEHYVKYGVIGNILKGNEISELESYTMSAAKTAIAQTLGKENIIEISPRMSPHTYRELRDFPSKDSLDASKDNIEKILKHSQKLLVEEDDKIRTLAQTLVDNLHNIGQMSDERYKKISNRIGIKSANSPLDSGIGQEIPGIIDRIFSGKTFKDKILTLIGMGSNDNQTPNSKRIGPPKGPKP